MKILCACEESQEVTKAFRELGHEAYSCDIQECSGGHPEWHIQGDVVPLLDQEWDLIIAFPPCTHLAVSGARHFKAKQADGRQQESIDFFNLFTNLKCEKVAIENPIGIMSTHYRKPNQIIHPYMFGDPFQKSTCLWLKGLPELTPTNIVDTGEITTFGSGKRMSKWMADAFKLSPEERAKVRSKTFPGIAKAMAEQWSNADTYFDEQIKWEVENDDKQ
jgi:site-specific DNA-cytosine methylase